MSTTHTSLAYRVISGASVLALAATGFAGVAAYADDAPTGPQFGNIDQTKTGSITVHKRESGSQGDTLGKAAEKTDVADAAAVKDVVFTAYKLGNFNPADGSHWQALKDLTVPATACDGNLNSLGTYTLQNGKPFPKTDASGDAKLDNLELGAYLVCETSAPTTVLKKALPFVVTVPFSGAETSGWLYHVHAYPKNTVVQAPVKAQTIGTLGMQTEDDFTFTIEAKIPSLAKKEYFKYVSIVDPMIANFSDIKIDKVQIDDQDVEQSHYTKNNPNASDQKNMVQVSFTKAGLADLKATKANKKVKVTIKAKLNTLPADGNVPNTGRLYLDTETRDNPPADEPPNPIEPPTNPGEDPKTPGGSPTPPPSTPSNKVGSLWGQFKFLKKDAGDHRTPLEGAEFKVYAVDGADAFAQDCTSTTKHGDAIFVNGADTFTSNEQGIVDIAGLLIETQSATGTADVAFTKEHRCFVLEEVKAPVGYAMPQQALTAIKVTKGVSNNNDIEVENTKVTVPELPLTGASGQLLMILAGAASVMLAVGGALVNRRRAAQR